jgi:peptidyl-prolyl cis-trans isomerase A (cyclophilin A)
MGKGIFPTLALFFGLSQVALCPVALAQPKPAQQKPFVPPAPGKAAAASVPVEVQPETGPFTLEKATQGLPGNGPLRASIEVEQGGKPLGTLRCELFADKAPLTVANFVGLARGLRAFRDPRTEKWQKKPLYDGNQLHRLIPGFMIQGGDPYCVGDPYCAGRHGAGDPGFSVPDEIRPELQFDRGGRLAMALRGDKNTAGSQFFITERETPWLNGTHTIFGQCEPLDVVQTISHLETGRMDLPKQMVMIKRVVVSRQPPASR